MNLLKGILQEGLDEVIKMKQKFHEELEEIEKEMLDMGKLAISMLEDAMLSLVKLDDELADKVLSRKKEITRYDEKIEEETLQYLTLFQPMAKDMRKIGSILKMITYLTRIGRYGKDIANITKEISAQPHVSKLVTLPHMSEMVIEMISDTLKSFETGDISLIKDLEERDDSIDAQRYSIFRESISYMMEEPKAITRLTHYIMIARYLERCADHACKMGEKVHYMVTGEHIEIR